MILLSFSVKDARPSLQTAAPSTTFRLSVEELSRRPIHAMLLRCHVRIDPRGRRYSAEERTRLYELFGDVAQWDRTLQMVTWAQTTALVPAFCGQAEFDLSVPCTYDLEVAASKYLHAIRDGDVPLVFLFSGTAFAVDAENSSLSVDPVPWDREASYRMPASVWHSTMDQFFPGGGWMRVSRETLDRLQAFRGRHALVSWDDTVERLLRLAEPAEQVI